MNLLRRSVTAAILLGVLFVIVQFAPHWAFFVFGQIFIIAALLELFALAGRKGLHPNRPVGIALTLLVGLPFYVRALPLEAGLFAGLLV
ncbi:MAG TPA: hypothetical protein VLJ16_01640, partial [Acidobacteriota bacterium]|nr:hypothetical protein [Acidobacteriota bacterium]